MLQLEPLPSKPEAVKEGMRRDGKAWGPLIRQPGLDNDQTRRIDKASRSGVAISRRNRMARQNDQEKRQRDRFNAKTQQSSSGQPLSEDGHLDGRTPCRRTYFHEWRFFQFATNFHTDVLLNIVIPPLNGLAIENERTWFRGRPGNEQVKLWISVRNANEAAIAAVRTGHPVNAIDAAAQAEIEKAGFGDFISHRTGHAIGIIHHAYPEDMAFCHWPLLDDEVYLNLCLRHWRIPAGRYGGGRTDATHADVHARDAWNMRRCDRRRQRRSRTSITFYAAAACRKVQAAVFLSLAP